MRELLTVAAAALILKAVPGAVASMTCRGGLTAIRTGGGLRLFHREDGERLAEERKGAPASGARRRRP